jgi:hypothetical protein
MSPRQRAANTRNQTPALLRGLIFGPTGTAMTPTTAKRGSRIYRYYVSMDVIRNRDSDPVTGPQRLASCAAAYVARVTLPGSIISRLPILRSSPLGSFSTHQPSVAT